MAEEGRLPVTMGAVQALKELLVNTGGPLRDRSVEQLREVLLEAANRSWGSREGGEGTIFLDNQGGGYLLDLSHRFGDVMVYALVREVNGQMGVLDVVDEAEVEELKKDLSDSKNRASRGVDEEHRRNLFPRRPPEALRRPQVEYSGPYLVRWQVQKDQESPPVWNQEKVHADAVAEKVQELVAGGVSAKDIEIWTTMKRPQVNVVLV